MGRFGVLQSAELATPLSKLYVCGVPRDRKAARVASSKPEPFAFANALNESLLLRVNKFAAPVALLSMSVLVPGDAPSNLMLAVWSITDRRAR